MKDASRRANFNFLKESPTLDHINANQKRIQHLICNQASPLDEFLCSQLNLSKERFFELQSLGAIYVNEQRQLQNTLLKENDYVRVHLEPKRFQGFEFQKDWIVLQTEDFIVFNKPSGLPCHPTLDNFRENLLEIATHHLQMTLFVTHRLDVPTSGLILFARNKAMLSYFNKCLEAHTVQKKYEAMVHGCLTKAPQRLTHYMKKEVRSPKVLTHECLENTLKCELILLESQIQSENFSHLKIQLLTGRTHQIRAQLGFIGHPIVGDTLYGAPKTDHENKIKLHCSSLQYPDRNDSKKLWSIESPAPF